MYFETPNGRLRLTIDKETQKNNLLELTLKDVDDIALSLAVLDYQQEINRFSSGLASSVDSISKRDYIIGAYLRNKRSILKAPNEIGEAQKEPQKKLK